MIVIEILEQVRPEEHLAVGLAHLLQVLGLILVSLVHLFLLPFQQLHQVKTLLIDVGSLLKEGFEVSGNRLSLHLELLLYMSLLYHSFEWCTSFLLERMSLCGRGC